MIGSSRTSARQPAFRSSAPTTSTNISRWRRARRCQATATEFDMLRRALGPVAVPVTPIGWRRGEAYQSRVNYPERGRSRASMYRRSRMTCSSVRQVSSERRSPQKSRSGNPTVIW